MRRLLLAMTLLTLLIFAAPLPCAAVPSSATTRSPFKDAIQPQLYELPSAALGTWRGFAATKPTLVIFAGHPMLDTLSEQTQVEIRELLRSGSAMEIARRGRFETANPLFLPQHTASAAISAGLVSEVVFVMPTPRPLAEFSLEEFRKQASAAGYMSKVELDGLTLKDASIAGTVSGIPFRCVHPGALPKIAGPVLLHIDLGFLRGMYANEIKTPAYDLLYQLATAVREAGWSTLAVTLSYSNQEGGIPLASRFMISDLAEILRKPKLLDGTLPVAWNARRNALYLEAMFMESEARKVVEQGAKSSPRDPASLYSLAILQLQTKRVKEAFATLDRAVRLDPGYGLEYLVLAKQGIDIGQFGKTVALMNKAVKTFPDNPFMRMHQADLLIQAGRGQEALPIIADLRRLGWSPVFHPEIPGFLDSLEVAAKAPRKEAPAGSRHPAHMGIPDHRQVD